MMLNVVDALPGLGTETGLGEKLGALPEGNPDTLNVKESGGPGAKVSEIVTVYVATVNCGATCELGVTVTLMPPIRA